MIGVLIVTHGSIGEALLTSATQILGVAPRQVATLSVWRQDDLDDLVLRARELLEGLDAATGARADRHLRRHAGNVVSRLLEDGRIEGVSGASLPMLLRVLTGRNGSLSTRCSERSPEARRRGAHEQRPLLRCLARAPRS